MSVRLSPWSIGGTLITALTIPLIIFAHAYPYWQQVTTGRETETPHLGLWEICFPDEGSAAPLAADDRLGQRYTGCVYVFDRELRDIVDWIYTDWFVAVVAFVTLALVIQPSGLIINLLYYLRVCGVHREHMLILVSCILNWLCGLIVAIAIFIFGLKAAKDKEWMPNPESNHLSYSFAVCALVPVFCFLAGMCHTVDFLRLKSYRDRNARAKVYARGEFARY